jgi:hypothetical protein
MLVEPIGKFVGSLLVRLEGFCRMDQLLKVTTLGLTSRAWLRIRRVVVPRLLAFIDGKGLVEQGASYHVHGLQGNVH